MEFLSIDFKDLMSVILVLGFGSLLALGKLLTIPGALLASLMAVCLWIAGGFGWIIPALVFLMLSSLWTRWPGGSKRIRRNSRQVLANGLVAIAGSIIAIIGYKETGVIIMTGAFAAAAADTWSTEWGKTFGGKPVSLRSFKKVEPGVSGAVSKVGTIASVFGSGSVVIAGYFAEIIDRVYLVPLIIAGVLGGVGDSLAGAFAQAIWRDRQGRLTEEKTGKSEYKLERGISWIDNNIVNLIATIIGALSALFLVKKGSW